MRSFGPAAMQPRRRGGEPNGEKAHARPAQIARHTGAMTGAGHSGEAALFPSLAGRWAHRVLTAGTAAVLFAMMVLTFADVFGRKFLANPVPGAYEVSSLLMGMLIFTALPLVTAREDHVTINVFDNLIPYLWRRWQRTIVAAICAVTLGGIAWRFWLLAIDHAKNNEVTATLYIRHAPFTYLFSIMAALSAVACLVHCWEYLSGRRVIRIGPTIESAG